MTPERERQIRDTLAGHETCARAECQAWRASVSDVLEELDRLRAAAEFTKRAIQTRTALLARVVPDRPAMAQQFDSGGIDALERLLQSGRELGLFKTTTATEPGGHG